MGKKITIIHQPLSNLLLFLRYYFTSYLLMLSKPEIREEKESQSVLCRPTAYDSPASLYPILHLSSNSLRSGSSALPSNMAYFGSSQEEDDLEEENEEEEEEFRTGSGIHSHGAGSSSQASTSSSCHSTPCKGKLAARQPLNGHGKDRTTCHML